jgi:glutamate/tyrosine decarboxylase-like PLP-dependent enzyme
VPEWSGGIYATSRDPGSHQCVSVLHAFVALVTVGANGYKQIAASIYRSCVEMAAAVKEYPQLELVCEPQVNVVCFRSNPKVHECKSEQIMKREIRLVRFFLH